MRCVTMIHVCAFNNKLKWARSACGDCGRRGNVLLFRGILGQTWFATMLELCWGSSMLMTITMFWLPLLPRGGSLRASALLHRSQGGWPLWVPGETRPPEAHFGTWGQLGAIMKLKKGDGLGGGNMTINACQIIDHRIHRIIKIQRSSSHRIL